MKETIFLIILLPIIANAQYFGIVDLDTNDYPIMKGRFYSIDENGQQILDHNPANFEIYENHEPRDVISVNCPEYNPEVQTFGLLVDANNFINLARHGSERFIQVLNMPLNEVGISFMHITRGPRTVQEPTKIKEEAIEGCKSIPKNTFGAKVSDFFFSIPYGGIELISKREIQNRVLIYISDLNHATMNFDEEQLYEEIRDKNIRIYSVILGTKDVTGLFSRITENTNGLLFDDIQDSLDIKKVFEEIAYREQSIQCELSWESNTKCINYRNLEIINNSSNLSSELDYQINHMQLVRLELNPYLIDFGQLIKDELKDTTIQIKAINADQIIKSITFEPENESFEVLNKFPLSIDEGETADINIHYSTKDTIRHITNLVFNTDHCNPQLNILSGNKDIESNKSTLNLIYPNGGELFEANTQTEISWKSNLDLQNFSIEFSPDNGKDWQKIEDSFIGKNTTWNVPNFNSDSCIIKISPSNKIDTSNTNLWSKTYGGSDFDVILSCSNTLDGGIIAIGKSHSNDYDLNKNTNFGAGDFLITKLNNLGTLEWSKTYGGSEKDMLKSVTSTRDGGFLVVGESESNDGELQFSKNKGKIDVSVLKLDNIGNIEWSNSFGGSNTDIVTSCIETINGDFLVIGYTASNDGDFKDNPKHSNGSYYRMFILKLTALGEKKWIKIYVGINHLFGRSIIASKDGNYLVLAEKSFIEENMELKQKIWVVKFNEEGEILDSLGFSGSKGAWARSFTVTKDGGLIVVGETMSDDLDFKGNNIHGNDDIYAAKFDRNYKIEWIQTYGGSSYEERPSVIELNHGGFLIACMTNSNDFDLQNKNFKGGRDAWIFKVDNNGKIVWSELFGGQSDEILQSSLLHKNNECILVGSTFSKDGDLENQINKGSSDSWIIGFDESILLSDTSDNIFSIKNSMTSVIDNSSNLNFSVSINVLTNIATVKFNVFNYGLINIELYDSQGKKLKNLHNGYEEVGLKEFHFDLSNYSNGRFYIKLSTQTATKIELFNLIR